MKEKKMLIQSLKFQIKATNCVHLNQKPFPIASFFFFLGKVSNSIFSIKSSTSHIHNSSNNNNSNIYHKRITLTQTQKQNKNEIQLQSDSHASNPGQW